jgi:hypothetical protein
MCYAEIKTDDDLLPPGAPVGTIPTDLDQSTGLERLEILGKMEGVDIFDMKPLDSSRKGTLTQTDFSAPDPRIRISLQEMHNCSNRMKELHSRAAG